MRSPRRMMCASVLGLECIVLGLMTPVLITVADVDTALSLVIGLGLAVVAVLTAGLLRHEWAYYVGFAIQVAAFAVGVVIPVMFVLGVIFGALWTTAYVLGRKIEAEQSAARSPERGAG